ncbi:MAG: copper amine oxidase N-terminal domain-containing protein [Bacillota bacterium]
MKRFLVSTLVLVLTAFAALPAQALSGGESGILVDGKPLLFDVPPQVVDGVLMVPIRAVAEAMEGVVSWDEKSQRATITSGNRTVVFTVGKSVALLDDREVMLSGKVVKRENRTFVPASFLLVFYGSRLNITHPAVRDPKAVELLLRSAKAAPTHFDLSLKQGLHMTDGIMTIEMETLMEGQVRGEEALLSTRVKSMMLPPGSGDTVVAIKGGKQFVQAQGQWHEVPVADPAAATAELSPSAQFADPDLLQKLILEAHLGESVTVQGRKLQDVVVTYDMNRLFTLFGDMFPPELMEAQLSFERFTTIITIDMETGAVVSQMADVGVQMQAEGRQMRMDLKLEMKVTPSRAPIAWPAELQ